MVKCTRYNIMGYSLSVTYDRLIFSTGTQASSTNKTDRDDVTEILLKMVLNATNPPSQFWSKRTSNTSLVKAMIENKLVISE